MRRRGRCASGRIWTWTSRWSTPWTCAAASRCADAFRPPDTSPHTMSHGLLSSAAFIHSAGRIAVGLKGGRRSTARIATSSRVCPKLRAVSSG
jgi:hypothetical protein